MHGRALLPDLRLMRPTSCGLQEAARSVRWSFSWSCTLSTLSPLCDIWWIDNTPALMSLLKGTSSSPDLARMSHFIPISRLGVSSH